MHCRINQCEVDCTTAILQNDAAPDAINSCTPLPRAPAPGDFNYTVDANMRDAYRHTI